MNSKDNSASKAAVQAARQAWVEPVLEELPRLEELTLQTSITGTGSTAEGGSLIFQ